MTPELPRPVLLHDTEFANFGQQVAGLLDAAHDGRLTDDDLLQRIRELGYINDSWREPWGLDTFETPVLRVDRDR